MREFLQQNRLMPFGVFFAPETAGWHDGEKVHVSFDHLNKDAVFYHEQAHETVFLKTADGLLLSVLFKVLDSRSPVDAKVIRRVEVTAAKMVEASLRAHEITATYIGLKMLSPEDALATQKLLPLEYKKYYEAASKIIDKYFGSTFFQVVVFSTVAHFAFGSMLFEAFVSQNWPRYTKLKPEYQPNYRLDKLLRYLGNGKINELRAVLDATADAFFETNKFERWNLDSENDWPTGQAQGHMLDRILAKSVETWLAQQNLFPYLSGERKKEALVRLNSRCEKFGFQYDIREKILSEIHAEDLILPMDINRFFDMFSDGDAIAAAVRQAGSLVSNSRVLQLPHLPNHLLEIILGVKDAQELIVVGADPYNSEANWTVLVRAPSIQHTNCTVGEHGYLGVQASLDDIVGWLNSLETGEWVGSEPTLFVLSYGSKNEKANHVEHISWRWHDRTVFCPLNNWSGLVDIALSMGSIEVTQVMLHIRENDAMDDSTDETIMVLNIARGEQLPGKYTIRSFSKNANLGMFVLHNNWEKQAAFISLSTEDARDVGFDITSAATAFGCIMAFWSFF
ncbi:MAG: hypothetical protein ACRER8_23205 [Pseudomonas sp.]|uniref:hypothetical protein n=1 Tax=Pseudomonas sp. TaxID=306 RepID=UPI003D7017F7